jgi:hypothetical protein
MISYVSGYWILTFKKYNLNYEIFTEFYLKNCNMTKNNNFFKAEPGMSLKIPNINNLDFYSNFKFKKIEKYEFFSNS